MLFTLGKSLRVLGVVEFVVFFVGLVKSICCSCEITVSGFESSAVDTYNLVKQVTDFFFTALETSIYISILVLLISDLRICQSSSVTIVIILAFCCLALRVVDKLLSFWRSRVPGKPIREKDEKRLLDFAQGFVGKSMPFFQKHLDKFSNFDSKWFGKLFVAFGLLIVLLFLSLTALQVFFFATTIKLAIPSEYEASCTDNSQISLVIMIGLPSLVIAIYLSKIICETWVHFSARKGPPLLIFAVFQLVTSIAWSVLSFILFIRLLKVWDEEEAQLYEYLGLAVGIPLLRQGALDPPSKNKEQAQSQPQQQDMSFPISAIL